MRGSIAGALFALLMLVSPTLCNAEEPRLEMNISSDTPVFTLNTGDKLRITVFNEPSLSGEFSVGGDGNVAFPLIGSVSVRDKTVSEAQELIRAKLADGYVTDPRVAIEVINYRPYYILGEIARPNEYPYSVGLTVDQAIAIAGGFTYRANRSKVFVRHADEQSERKVNIKKQNVKVLPGDTIRVGERYF